MELLEITCSITAWCQVAIYDINALAATLDDVLSHLRSLFLAICYYNSILWTMYLVRSHTNPVPDPRTRVQTSSALSRWPRQILTDLTPPWSWSEVALPLPAQGSRRPKSSMRGMPAPLKSHHMPCQDKPWESQSPGLPPKIEGQWSCCPVVHLLTCSSEGTAFRWTWSWEALQSTIVDRLKVCIFFTAFRNAIAVRPAIFLTLARFLLRSWLAGHRYSVLVAYVKKKRLTHGGCKPFSYSLFYLFAGIGKNTLILATSSSFFSTSFKSAKLSWTRNE